MHKSPQDTRSETLRRLGISDIVLGTYADTWLSGGISQPLYSPVDGSLLAHLEFSTEAHYETVVQTSVAAFQRFRELPAPKRGDLIREFAAEVRLWKEPLAELISWEMGKILPEALGEVQEVIDIADFSVGLSRQLYGFSMHSERPEHRMYEQWHPLGPCGVITAFNFPMAVWAWNACIAAVCGNTVIWKPSEYTPLSAFALSALAARVAAKHGHPALFSLLSGTGASIGVRLAEDRRLPLISATGSTAMGRDVGARVAKRLGRSLLELGGNNAVIVLQDADLELSTRAILFGAVGTAGQRCTSIRRLFVEKPVHDALLERLKRAYANIRIGSPLDAGTLMGPLIHSRAVEQFEDAIKTIRSSGGTIVFGGEKKSGPGHYVAPTLVSVEKAIPIMKEETFAPILYVQTVSNLSEAIAENNNVAQGLSSALFTASLKSAERFLAASGSDCGIANINIGTSGAEIGGAFGGEKDSGGGREAGSDAWKAYMRRQTTTINWGDSLPLAQGVRFE